jgi:hypothetical protein
MRTTGAILMLTRPATIMRSAWRGEAAKHLGAEARDVEARPDDRHHLDGAAGEAEAERPDRVDARLIDRPVHHAATW